MAAEFSENDSMIDHVGPIGTQLDTGEMKTGEVKTGEVKTAETKLGEMAGAE